jgi:hypothetical protein
MAHNRSSQEKTKQVYIRAGFTVGGLSEEQILALVIAQSIQEVDPSVDSSDEDEDYYVYVAQQIQDIQAKLALSKANLDEAERIINAALQDAGTSDSASTFTVTPEELKELEQWEPDGDAIEPQAYQTSYFRPGSSSTFAMPHSYTSSSVPLSGATQESGKTFKKG